MNVESRAFDGGKGRVEERGDIQSFSCYLDKTRNSKQLKESGAYCSLWSSRPWWQRRHGDWSHIWVFIYQDK